MLDFFWFKRTEVTDSAGRHRISVDGVNLGGILSTNKQAHRFVGGKPANDSNIKGATR